MLPFLLASGLSRASKPPASPPVALPRLRICALTHLQVLPGDYPTTFCAKTAEEADALFELAGIYNTTSAHLNALDGTPATPMKSRSIWQPPKGFAMSDRIVDICPHTCAAFGVYVSGCAPPSAPPSAPPAQPPSPSPSPPSPPSPPPSPLSPDPSPPSMPPSPLVPKGAGVVSFSATVATTVDDFDAGSYTSRCNPISLFLMPKP